MDGADALVMPNEASHRQLFEGYKDHFNGHRISSELVFLELLRKTYPGFRVTCTNPSKCDFLGYATAGHATAATANENVYDASRSYKAPGPRLEKKPGMLADHVRLGRWQYKWKHFEYLFYIIEYTEPMRPPIKLYYVLSPLSQDDGKEGDTSSLDELLLAVGAWSADLHEEIYVFDDGFWTKNHELWKSVQSCSWDDVILNPEMKANLIEDVQGFFDNQQLYRKLAVPWKRGLILHGVPGNGKTISIKAIISALSGRDEPIPSLYVKSFDACQGSKYSIHSIFMHARIMAPCLLIFEDLDSLVTDETRSYFLNEVDGLESNDGILMIGSTNHLETLDPAISRRPSRFDRKYHFKIPSEEERTAYCQFWRQKLADNDLVDFQEELCPIIAKMTDGFSFAYLKELFIIALLTVARGAKFEEDIALHDQHSPKGYDTSSSTSTDGHVVVEHDEVAGSAERDPKPVTTAENAAEKPMEKEESAKAKRVVPEVDIPETLQDNLLLKIIRSQMKILLEEMENTKEEEWPSTKTQGGVPGLAMMPRRRAVRLQRLN